MRWGTPTKHPKVGDKRWFTRLAVLPTQLSDGTWVWLQRYEVEQGYVSDIGNGDMMEGGDPGWVDARTWMVSGRAAPEEERT